jgi:hypothetical protein
VHDARWYSDRERKLIGNADLAHSANLIEREKIDS